MSIRVLICDEAAPMRTALGAMVERQPDMSLAGCVAGAEAARDLLRSRPPDVLILDADMPSLVESGLAEALAGLRPSPLVLVNSGAERSKEKTRRALGMGAAEFFCRPAGQGSDELRAYARHVVERIRALRRDDAVPAVPPPRTAPTCAMPPASLAGRPGDHPLRPGTGRVIVIGASTGGTEAIKEVLQALPASMPPILVVQHMPEMFTPSFARRLDGLSALHVKEADDGERIGPGTVYLAPGHSHLSLARAGGGYQCVLSRGEPVNRHRPSVDVLFHSAAGQVGAAAIGILLTGMGKDGAKGLLALRQAGAWTVAQDRDSCVVYGMPREAVAIGAAHEVHPLHEIAPRLLAELRLAAPAS